MRSNVFVFWPALFDFYQSAFLLVDTDSMLSTELLALLVSIIIVRMTLDTCLVGVTALLQARIVEFSTSIKHPLQLVGSRFIRVDTVFESFDAHRTLS